MDLGIHRGTGINSPQMPRNDYILERTVILELGTIRHPSHLFLNRTLLNDSSFPEAFSDKSSSIFFHLHFQGAIIIWVIQYFSLAGFNSLLISFSLQWLHLSLLPLSWHHAQWRMWFMQYVLNTLRRTLWKNLMLRKKMCNASPQLHCKQIFPAKSHLLLS